MIFNLTLSIHMVHRCGVCSIEPGWVELVSVHEDNEIHSLDYKILTLGMEINKNTYSWLAAMVANLQNNERNEKMTGIQIFLSKGSCLMFCFKLVLAVLIHYLSCLASFLVTPLRQIG